MEFKIAFSIDEVPARHRFFLLILTVMNNIFDTVELKMIDHLAKTGFGVKKKYSDRKRYLKELIRSLYMNS